jgi:NAD(P)-dependent dehydrogenase (short-subunit alcohol dehydrogenase family)
MASITLPAPTDSFLQIWFKHQFLASPKPPLGSHSLAKHSAVITGSNVGIGLEAARLLLSLQLGHLILAVRSQEKGEKAAGPLRRLYPDVKIDVWCLDLSSYESIQLFVQKCATLPRLDIAILNAGIMNNEFKFNPTTGHEETLQINYLSTALLALLLLPILRRRNPSESPGRLTIVSSVAAVTTDFPERDEVQLIASLDKEEGWNSSVAKQRYDVTKLLLLMFMFKLSRIVKAEDTVVNAVDPGFTQGTGLFRNIPMLVRAVLWPIVKLSATYPEKGAWTYIDAAVARGIESHGNFLSDWQISP